MENNTNLTTVPTTTTPDVPAMKPISQGKMIGIIAGSAAGGAGIGVGATIGIQKFIAWRRKKKAEKAKAAEVKPTETKSEDKTTDEKK